MKSSKLPGMLSVKSKKGLDYMDMILKTTDLCKNFKGQMAVNNVSLNICIYRCSSDACTEF